ncbi:hypothetical protein I4U23_014080 [Adineta vaga]|nr:hypothetical protein I4U23_014080 [Adineta vaga]
MNTYLTLVLTSIAMLIIYVYSLSGDLHSFISKNNHWCQLRTYFVNVCFCSLYYSCVLQSIFRLFRVIFHQIKLLQSTQFFLLAILFQWVISFSLISLNLINHDYQHLLFLNRCWISFENTRGLLLTALIIYGCPLLTIVSIYTYIVRYIHYKTQFQQKRRTKIERDLLILKRITLFVFVVTTIGLPTILILLIWIISGILIPMAYYIQGLSMSIGLFIASICFAFISPQIQNLFNQKKQQNVRSSIMNRNYQPTHLRLSQKETDESI